MLCYFASVVTKRFTVCCFTFFMATWLYYVDLYSCRLHDVYYVALHPAWQHDLWYVALHLSWQHDKSYVMLPYSFHGYLICVMFLFIFHGNMRIDRLLLMQMIVLVWKCIHGTKICYLGSIFSSLAIIEGNNPKV